MGYTDSQMIIASQIAYFDFDEALMADGGCTVREALEYTANDPDSSSGSYARYVLRLLDDLPEGQVCGDWIIKDVRNDQHGSGMYACMLETGKREALIAFRGSESDTKENLLKDWGLSDLGLFNNRLTVQQKAAQKYTEDLFRKYGDYYTYSTTGHSLGGNLAEHAAVTIPEAMRSCFDRCVNLDGPGYSAAYLTAHALEIRAMKGHLQHDSWSLVGALLNPVPGSDYRVVAAATPGKKNTLQSLLWRHDTTNVAFDKNGNMLAGSKDRLAAAVDDPVRLADLTAYGSDPDRLVYLAAWNLVGEYRNARDRRYMEKDGKYDPGPAADAGPEGDFEAACAGVERIMDSLESVKTKIWDATQELERASCRIPFQDAATQEAWRRFLDDCGEMNRVSKRAEDYVEAGRSCMKEIRKAEKNVEELFRVH